MTMGRQHLKENGFEGRAYQQRRLGRQSVALPRNIKGTRRRMLALSAIAIAMWSLLSAIVIASHARTRASDCDRYLGVMHARAQAIAIATLVDGKYGFLCIC